MQASPEQKIARLWKVLSDYPFQVRLGLWITVREGISYVNPPTNKEDLTRSFRILATRTLTNKTRENE